MKMQITTFTACLITAGLISTGFSAPVMERDIITSSDSGYAHQVHNPNLVDIDTPLSKRLLGSSSKSKDTKTAPAKTPAKPATNPATNPATKPVPAKPAPKPAPGKPAPAPAKPAKPAQAAVKLQFTKYPKKVKQWSPPKVAAKGGKKPLARRHSDPTEHDPEDEEHHTLDRRARKTVEAGTVVAGTAADELLTWNVNNCISVAAYEVSSGRKRMAHINGESASGVDYSMQWASFADEIYKWTGEIEVWARMPHKDVIPEDKKDLKPLQAAFEKDIKGWLAMMSSSPVPTLKFKVFVKPATRVTGDMAMLTSGDVIIDS